VSSSHFPRTGPCVSVGLVNRLCRIAWCVVLSWVATGCEKPTPTPENTIAYQRARRAVEAKDFAAAAAAYRLVLDEHPRFGRAHLELGLLADEKLGDPVLAIYHYRRYHDLETSADKRRVIEDYVERAKLALAARLPKPEGVDTAELVRLQNQNAALMIELTGLRSKVTELETALQAAAQPPVSPGTSLTGSVAALPLPPPILTQVVANAEPARPATHKVVKGDTLYSIAARYYGSRAAWEKIHRANQANLPNKDQLRIGQELVLP